MEHPAAPDNHYQPKPNLAPDLDSQPQKQADDAAALTSEVFTGLKVGQPKTKAAGLMAVAKPMEHITREAGLVRGNRILLQLNQIRHGAQTALEDALVVEDPLEIRIEGRRYTATMRAPGETGAEDLLLAQGLLFSEGVISGLDDIERIEWGARCRDLSDELVPVVSVTLHDSASVPAHLWERSIISNSSCGLCGKASVEALSARFAPLQSAAAAKRGCCKARLLQSAALDLEILRDLPDKMRPHQRLFDQTGGCHAAAIFDARGELLCCYEDIGRHNATDKALGFGLENGFIPAPSPLILLVSGRASFEIVQKALVARIETVCSVSAASSLAVDLAARNNLHLVGFLRPRGLTVYMPH